MQKSINQSCTEFGVLFERLNASRVNKEYAEDVARIVARLILFACLAVVITAAVFAAHAMIPLF